MSAEMIAAVSSCDLRAQQTHIKSTNCCLPEKCRAPTASPISIIIFHDNSVGKLGKINIFRQTLKTDPKLL